VCHTIQGKITSTYVQHTLNADFNTGHNENSTNIQESEILKGLRKMLYTYCSAKRNKHMNGMYTDIYKPVFNVT
jgi:hypothetical protein